MIDFAKAWASLSVGDAVQVANGAAEPLDSESSEHRTWRSHNFTGAIAEKINGSPRQMRVELENAAGNMIGFLVQEGDGHSFVPALITPQLARDCRWEAAKAYREQRRNAPLPIVGVLANQVIVADCNLESRITIMGAFSLATAAKAAGAPYEIEFTDHTNTPFILNADETIALGMIVGAFNGACHTASQAVRAALDAAVAAGASAEDILAIDITAGYPA